jgi:hypothetical protein
MILIKDLLKETDKIYAERKLGEQCYTVPIALRPVVQSDQVKALAEAMANASNNELSVMKARILELERQLDIKRPVSSS